MRFVIALLLCLALPLQGWAAGAVAQTPCPMGETMAMTAADTSEAMADLGDCCNDAATMASTGKLCKTGQECQAPTGWLGSVQQPVIQALPTGIRLVIGSPTPPRGAPASVWRPPTL